MWANKNQTGFTIVETLIVLSITGLLFLMTMLLVRGQINNFQSKDAVTQLETALRTTLNDVSNGYYPDKGKLSCTLGLPVSASVDVAGGNVGTSTDCVYAGKSITFDTDKIVIKTLATDGSSTSLASAITKMSPVDGLDEVKDYKWGIKLYNPAPTSTIYILYSGYAPTVSSGNFVSGVQNVVLQDVSHNPLSTAKYCFSNGGKKSSLTFSGQGGLQVSSTVEDTTCP
jgi:type II secretory pathway pseudopilin PulG